jgi:hypothetical protein
MRNRLVLLAVASLVLAARPARGQYYDSQVLQKSFETTEFFFRPVWMNPFGLGSFGRSAAGFLRDPLVDLQLGPSRIAADSSGRDFVYLDFRSTSEKRSQSGGIYPMYELDMRAADSYMYPYPYYYRETRRPPEPVVALAVFARPAPGSLPDLTVGLTYEAVVDDQDYYRVPHDVYRSSLGADFAGERIADANMPIYDVYGGENGMHMVGHFPTLYAALGLADGWRLGARASFVDFDRSGSAGTTYGDPYPQDDYRSFNSYLEDRDQRYVSRDLSLGLERTVGANLFGASIGYLDGQARQHLARTDSSHYAWGSPAPSPSADGSLYDQGGATTSRWREDGGTTHGSVFFRRTDPGGRVITATYRIESQSVDLDVASASRDSSRSIYAYTWENGSSFSSYHSRLLDERGGTGERTGTTHRASAALEWPIQPSSSLTIGAVLAIERSTTETSEDVEAYRSRSHRNEWDGNLDTYSERIVETKTLDWSFQSRRTALRIPILFTHRFDERVQILVGITREMAEWRIEDETLARIEERSVTVNGQTDIRTNFGERYREPVEQRTDVDTDLLLGVTVTPADRIDVRLLMMPSWHDDAYGTSVRKYRWWLGMTFHP